MKKWRLSPKIEADFLSKHPETKPVILQLLFNRGLKTPMEINTFLRGALEPELVLKLTPAEETSFYNPFLFKDMVAAVDLIISHIKKKNPIIVYGDYDADGVTASVILLETLRILHGVVDVYLPDRVTEGYGLNQTAIQQIAAQGGKLIITVDNGVRNQAEVVYAKKLGLDVIITDHHVLAPDPADWPDCLIIDPAHPQDNYPWKQLAGVGVSYKLISALISKASLTDSQKKLILERCLDLVAVGTVADMVSLLGENRLLVASGLKTLNQSKRLGLLELIKVTRGNNTKPLEAWNIGWQIGPRLNAASRLSHANSAFSLLTTIDLSEAQTLAAELNQRNLSRQQITEEMIAQVEEQIDPNNLPPLIIGLAGENQIWNEGVVGLVAGRITEKYYRPALIITRLIEEAEFDAATKRLIPKKVSFKGSGRSVEEFNMIAAIEKCADLLDKYGGHPMACGFSIKDEENLEKFRQAILELATESLAQADFIPKLKIEACLNFSEIDRKLVDQLKDLAPFGQNNPQPRFVSYNLKIDDISTMGFDNQHIKIRLSDAASNSVTGSRALWALAFGAATEYQKFQIGDLVDLVYYLEINDFNGRQEIQLKIIDLRFASLELKEKELVIN